MAEETKLRILEIGPGTVDGTSTVFANCDTVDLQHRTQRSPGVHIIEWGINSLPMDSDTYDLVFASHVLEHVAWYRVPDALSEVLRVLKSGGEFEVYVPDFEHIVKSYQQKKCGDTWRVFNPNDDFMTWVNGRIFTYGPDATELLSPERPISQTHHRTVFDHDYLSRLLKAAGFANIEILNERRNGLKHSIPEVKIIARKH